MRDVARHLGQRSVLRPPRPRDPPLHVPNRHLRGYSQRVAPVGPTADGRRSSGAYSDAREGRRWPLHGNSAPFGATTSFATAAREIPILRAPASEPSGLACPSPPRGGRRLVPRGVMGFEVTLFKVWWIERPTLKPLGYCGEREVWARSDGASSIGYCRRREQSSKAMRLCRRRDRAWLCGRATASAAPGSPRTGEDAS